MAYVYRHIRLDKNIPFYIGISNGDDANYRRAFNKNGRNDIWEKITKISAYEVEILLDGITYDEAIKKEMEFIRLYGRKNIGTGVLANMTDGGEGFCNPSEERRRKMSETAKRTQTGLKHSESRNKTKSLAQGGKNHWNFGKKLKNETLIKKSSSMKKKYEGGYIHPMRGRKLSEDRVEKMRKLSSKPICQLSPSGELIREWESALSASKNLGICQRNISRSVYNPHLKAGGFFWTRNAKIGGNLT